jgi:hypothetical protein
MKAANAYLYHDEAVLHRLGKPLQIHIDKPVSLLLLTQIFKTLLEIYIFAVDIQICKNVKEIC